VKKYRGERLRYHAGIRPYMESLMGLFKDIESFACGDSVALDDALAALPWNADGLLPAIAQQHDTGEVLMLAWMNETALRETLQTGRVCYWSRSRQSLWRKGESSGQVQRLHEMRFDCDGDTVLLKVDQTGPACHTGRRDCFYNKVDGDRLVVDTAPLIDPEQLYGK
jgi:phosphoribosyl-AMP cyclohydrolase